MSRPRTKGEALTIRLSQHHDGLLRTLAAQADIPAGQMAVAMLEAALDPAPTRRTRASRAHSETCTCVVCTGQVKTVTPKKAARK